MKQNIWAKDWFAGLIITLAFLLTANSELLQSLERSTYDLGVRSSSRDPGDSIRIIAIDEKSIENIGRWPWSRDIHASMINQLHDAGAKVIGLSIFYSEPQQDAGLLQLRKIHDFYQTSGLASDTENQAVIEIGARLSDAEKALNTDAMLAESFSRAGNVILGMQMAGDSPLGAPDQPLPDYISRNALVNVDHLEALDEGFSPLQVTKVYPPIAELGEPSNSIGHMLKLLEVDGRLRAEPLVVQYYQDAYIPSLSLQIAARSLNLTVDDIKVNLGQGIQLGNLSISTDPYLFMQTFFYSNTDQPAFPVDSFYDVKVGNIPLSKYKDKIVLIGATASGVGTVLNTPVGTIEPIRILAHTVSSILNENFFIQPEWAGIAHWLVLLLVAAYLIGLLPRLKAGIAAGISAGLLVVLLGAELGMLISKAMWVQLTLPAALLFGGHLLLTTKRYLMTEKGKLKSDSESAESNRMLGLAYQQQGQLDMAFEKFRKAPLNDDIMEPLYNLALEFEGKRQFAKASSVYRYLSDYNPNFRDVKERIGRSTKMEETIMFGAAGSGPAAASMILDPNHKPMLGRYEVEKELGQGAMGVVYLGRDPKINRVVAIKTMALAAEFDADEVNDVKERFFREATAAGNLDHPNIVTIYDAGEEHDLAYIAMEYLKGEDLARYTKPDTILSINRVIAIIYKIADGLNFAHQQHVVHRDIKPANIMFDPTSGSLKITDFGIARITDSSKTKTGMVLGTPSYMSPEQLSGKKVDGRSDLFSLGVMLYQMLTGHLPFTGDSMATLMFKIANEPHPSPLDYRPDLETSAPCLMPIIDKALTKDPDHRYQTGAEMANAIKLCAKKIATKK